MRDATAVVRAGLGEVGQGAPFLPGPVFAGTFRHVGNPAGDPFTYGRYANPRWSAYEAAMCELEGGPLLAFA